MRYAIYWAPRGGGSLARFGASWLGRDAATGTAVPQPDLPGIAEITAEPRRYGFHATLKPPFALAGGPEEDLLGAVAGLAATTPTVDAPPLRLAAIGGFLALVTASAALDALAATCVTALDRWRAPPAPAELDRRRAGRLTARQEALMTRWGYPYVLEEFRFHMTLTRRLLAEERARLEPALAPLVAPFATAPQHLGDIAVFAEAAPGAPFTERARFPLRPG
jgi:putative phosphonate metabolism protein